MAPNVKRSRLTIWQRYRRLKIWSRLGAWGSVASIVSVPAAVLGVVLPLVAWLTPPPPPFVVRSNVMMSPAPPILYRYPSKFGDLLSPVGVATVLEIANRRSTVVKLSSYAVDGERGGHWYQLPTFLQPLNPTQFYWIDMEGNLANAAALDFATNSFDVLASKTTLAPGESLKGWVFLQWPSELRDTNTVLERLRITLDTTSGERQVAVIDAPRARPLGNADFAGDAIATHGRVDLSGLPVLWQIDVLRGLRRYGDQFQIAKPRSQRSATGTKI